MSVPVSLCLHCIIKYIYIYTQYIIIWHTQNNNTILYSNVQDAFVYLVEVPIQPWE